MDYPSNQDCTYTISQPYGTVIDLNFLDFGIDCPFTDYLEINGSTSATSDFCYYNYMNAADCYRPCGSTIPVSIHPNENKVWIR